MPQDEWQVIGMDYYQNDCSIALQQIRETIARKGIDLVAGSSLGGFLALLITGIQRIVINPCYSPSAELPKLGPFNSLPAPSAKMVATYASFEPLLKNMSENERTLVTAYFAKEDELLGDRYIGVFAEDFGDYHRIPGGHHLTDEAAKIICRHFTLEYQLLQKAHKLSFKNEQQIKESKLCGCFACRSIFPASEVTLIPEKDGQKTAWCPHCYSDAVLGDASGYLITEDFLQKMYEEWFC